jgi:hypothetical protein
MILSRSYDREQRREFDQQLAHVPDLTNRELDAVTVSLEEALKSVTEDLQPTKPLAFYVRQVDAATKALPQDAYLYVPVWRLKTFFRRIHLVLVGIDKLPEHTSLLIDVHGNTPRGKPGEVRIIEAALFEDMCALFNRAWHLIEPSKSPTAKASVIKESAAMRRGSVLAAFYLLEAYLNSIAFDHLVHRGKELSEKDLERITEWDEKKGGQRLVSFRDKLLHYPRIILGLDAPPIQENNCAEAAYLLQEAKSFRDAVVHANPRPTRETLEPEKEIRFWRIGSSTPIQYVAEDSSPQDEEPSDWVRSVDSAIALIRRIEVLIHGSQERLFWIQDRTEAGFFDESVFE